MVDKLSITLIRRRDETEDMNIAINLLAEDGYFHTAQAGSSGLLRDEDGAVAYWEWETV